MGSATTNGNKRPLSIPPTGNFITFFVWPQAIFLIFWPNKRCVTGALFRFGPRFQFICPPTELSLSEKFRRTSERKGNAGSAELPEFSWHSHRCVCEPSFIYDEEQHQEQKNVINWKRLFQPVRKDSDIFGIKLHCFSLAHIGGAAFTFLQRLVGCWLHVTIKGFT